MRKLRRNDMTTVYRTNRSLSKPQGGVNFHSGISVLFGIAAFRRSVLVFPVLTERGYAPGDNTPCIRGNTILGASSSESLCNIGVYAHVAKDASDFTDVCMNFT